MKVVLIGFMGTGKTTVGELLAETLKWPFYDTDVMMEQDLKMSVREIFERKGEPFFRDAEAAVIQLVTAFDKSVISTGGGAPLRQTNKDALSQNSLVVQLTARPETILGRVKEIKNRPLFPGGLEGVKTLTQERETHYQAIRDLTLETDQISPQEAVEQILSRLNQVKPS